MKSLFSLFAAFIVSSFVVTAGAQSVATYTGKFNGRAGAVKITGGNDSYAMSFYGDDGSSDLIGAGCNTVIGTSKSAKYKDGVVRKIVFGFSSGCDVRGQELTAEIKNGTLRLSVYKDDENMRICHFDQWGRQYCNDQWWPVYLTGKFKN